MASGTGGRAVTRKSTSASASAGVRTPATPRQRTGSRTSAVRSAPADGAPADATEVPGAPQEAAGIEPRPNDTAPAPAAPAKRTARRPAVKPAPHAAPEPPAEAVPEPAAETVPEQARHKAPTKAPAKDAKGTARTQAKPAARPVDKPAAESAAKPATKPAARTTAKTTSRTAPRSGNGTAAKVASGRGTRRRAAAGSGVGSGAAAVGELLVREDESPWSTEELLEVRSGLEQDVARLGTEIDLAATELQQLLRDSGEGTGDDQADAGAKTFEREQEISLANNSRGMLEQSLRALARLEDGSYGACESCGRSVGKMRLLAFPRATLCVSCKQLQERR